MNNFIKMLNKEIEAILPAVEEIYKDLHEHPELPLQEVRTAKIVADYLKNYGYEVTEKIGGTGVVGVLKNGSGATIMLRADMDALPVKEETGLDYASKCEGINAKGETVPIMHACGHDMNTTWLLGASAVLAGAKNSWQGTLIVLFQPAEEIAAGSKNMLNDGLMERFPRPDAIFAQHLVNFKAGEVRTKPGQIFTAGDSLLVRFFGKGAHGGMPHQGIDPLVMAASAVLRLQTIVSREISPYSQAVVTVGEFHAGTAENIIADNAYIKLNIRTTDAAVREHVLEAVKRVCIAEARASNAPLDPVFEEINNFPLTVNDPVITKQVTAAFEEHFKENAGETLPLGASEDFARYGNAWGTPYMYWFVGGVDIATYDNAVNNNTLGKLPGPHSPFWAPAINPTLKTGLEAMLIAAGLWLKK